MSPLPVKTKSHLPGGHFQAAVADFAWNLLASAGLFLPSELKPLACPIALRAIAKQPQRFWDALQASPRRIFELFDSGVCVKWEEEHSNSLLPVVPRMLRPPVVIGAREREMRVSLVWRRRDLEWNLLHLQQAIQRTLDWWRPADVSNLQWQMDWDVSPCDNCSIEVSLVGRERVVAQARKLQLGQPLALVVPVFHRPPNTSMAFNSKTWRLSLGGLNGSWTHPSPLEIAWLAHPPNHDGNSFLYRFTALMPTAALMFVCQQGDIEVLREPSVLVKRHEFWPEVITIERIGHWKSGEDVLVRSSAPLWPQPIVVERECEGCEDRWGGILDKQVSRVGVSESTDADACDLRCISVRRFARLIGQPVRSGSVGSYIRQRFLAVRDVDVRPVLEIRQRNEQWHSARVLSVRYTHSASLTDARLASGIKMAVAAHNSNNTPIVEGKHV